MAYADHKQGSTRIVSIVIVALIHVILGYGFVTGLASQYIKKAAQQLNVIDVKEPPPPEQKPPPPPPDQPLPPPPVVSPPSVIELPSVSPPTITTVATPPPIPSPPPVITPPPPPAPPPKQPSKGASPRGDPGEWATPDDYPPRALREERAGTTGFRVTVGADGRVTGCTVTSSSGSPELDTATCSLVTRRARFTPAEDENGNKVAGAYSNRVVWRIPKD